MVHRTSRVIRKGFKVDPELTRGDPDASEALRKARKTLRLAQERDAAGEATSGEIATAERSLLRLVGRLRRRQPAGKALG